MEVDLSNASAFMVHHVLNKKKNKNKDKLQKKRSRKARKGVLKTKENAIASRRNNISTSKNNQVKLFENIHKKPALETPTNFNQLKTQSPVISATRSSMNAKIKSSDSPKNQSINSKNQSPKIVEDEDQKPVIVSTPSKSKEKFENFFIEKRLFEWLIKPIDVDEFMTTYWEKEPLHIPKRHSEFSLLLSTPIINSLLHYSNIIYTKNIDITFYSNGEKELHNQEGVARPHVVWDFFCNKCSIRLLNPQTFVPSIHKLNSELQEYFGCFVGCNAYLTPPHSQGFAPHYDDIEAFILQIEGKKLWKVYRPASENELLPRYSSCDLNAAEIGDPLLEVLLEEGDVLYLPRGYIHQASTQDSNHSLHITISVYQCNAWVDLLEKALPRTIEHAWRNDIEFRKGLPLDYLKAGGFAKHPAYKNTRSFIKKHVKSLIHKLADYVQIDSAIDQLGHKLMQDALPPVLTEEEKKCSVFGGGLTMTKKGVVEGFDEFAFDEKAEVVLLRQYVARFVKELEKGKNGKDKFVFRLYYTTDNSLEYHAEPTSFLIIPRSSVKCVQTLFHRYPEYVAIGELPHADEVERNSLVADLWERGVIRTKEPILRNN